MIVAMTAETIRCAWCSQTFVRPPRGSGQPQVYCSRLHQDWANAVAMGKYPLWTAHAAAGMTCGSQRPTGPSARPADIRQIVLTFQRGC